MVRPGPPAGPAGGGRGAVTGGGETVDLEAWTFWWEFNKDPFINLRAAIYDNRPQTGDSGFFLGQGKKEQAKSTMRPDADAINRIVRALKSSLETETNNDIVTGCLIALAKIGDTSGESGTSEFAGIIGKFLADSNQEISETAAVALGILANPTELELLQALVQDSPAGQKAVGSSEVDVRTRAFAGYGLGLMAAQNPDSELRQRIVQIIAESMPAAERLSLPDVAVALLTSMGLTPLDPSGKQVGLEDDEEWNPWDSREAQITYLIELFNDPQRNRFIAAHAPVAMGRLLEGLEGYESFDAVKQQVADALLLPLDKRKGRDISEELQQSAAFALGLVGDCDADPVDVAIREALIDELDGQQMQTRKFGLIALAKSGANRGDNEEDPWAGRVDVEKFLLKRLTGATGGEQLWAAMALGVYGNYLSEAGDETPPSEVRRAVQTAFQKAKVANEIGAYAIALGMLKDQDAKSSLRERLSKVTEPTAQGYIALALGLVRDAAAQEKIQELVRASEYQPDLLKQAAIALGLLGDNTIVPDLIEMMGNAGTITTQAALASALGFIGDERSVNPLIEMLEDDALPETGRGFAAVALGIVADKEMLPWNSKIAVDVNYRASTSTLNSTDGIGLLNIL